jgi:hypothetical protein
MNINIRITAETTNLKNISSDGSSLRSSSKDNCKWPVVWPPTVSTIAPWHRITESQSESLWNIITSQCPLDCSHNFWCSYVFMTAMGGKFHCNCKQLSSFKPWVQPWIDWSFHSDWPSPAVLEHWEDWIQLESSLEGWKLMEGHSKKVWAQEQWASKCLQQNARWLYRLFPRSPWFGFMAGKRYLGDNLSYTARINDWDCLISTCFCIACVYGLQQNLQ